MNNWLKRNGIHLAITGIFIVICFIYFLPAFQGKVLSQGDVIRAQATQKEIMDVKAKTGTAPLWTNSMFGGMPAYQIWTFFPSNATTWVVKVVKDIFPNPVDTVLIMLLGAYLLFCVLKLNPWLAAAGAIAFTFSTYNIILLDAGHANQAFAIAFFAPIIAGILLTLRGRYWLGGALTAFFLAMEIRANHIQMTYYLMIAILVLVGIELYHAIKAKQTKPFFTSIVYLAAATLLALAVNASMLWTTYEYGKESNRGKSNLTQHTSEPSNGLDKEYAYQWSQGVGECFTFLVPNAYGGGAITPVQENSKVVQTLTQKGASPEQAQGLAQQLGTYWGNKPFTEGPFYFGAGICFLFILGLLIVKSRLKWWLLAVTVLTMFLSFGKNLPFLSDLFFNYFPLYNKFRAVESILAVAGLCVPILALLAVQEVIAGKDEQYLLKKLYIAGGIAGGLTLILLAVPELFLSFKGPEHQNMIAQLTQMLGGDSGTANSIASALIEDRKSLEQHDAIRSLIFIVIAFGLVWALIKHKLNVATASIGFLILALVDMWTVDKRFLSEDHFGEKQELSQQIKPREVDQFILRDTDPDFRVLDLTSDPFTNAFTSYYHKSIGGYHAAKLKRYQELIDNQLTKSVNQDVLDMLNTKYIINSDPKNQQASMQVNQTACGHAWFVKNVKYVDNADQEMQAISSFDPKNEAIVDKRFRKLIDEKQNQVDPTATLTLTSYAPDHMVYQSGATATMVAVFSEIYYDKGWKMLIDGKEQPYFRADYILRAAQIPLGNHKIEFVFHPTSYYTGEGISLAGSILLALALGGVAFREYKKKPEPATPQKK
ncbi:YfhO family protein [Mucilaginibacter sp. RS28]|uniref:YfhO family protein n=1 Tax=Mucilaginibacter straminoryzae TaxID=2932774 RepID=A0A9X2BDU5_9SPHI|nr:YfhO family protein [Mucilaginibacter straminoryzae]MCJ8210708.1 YfhO family protein [Mucilaginibacter straminoryzae]